MKKGKYIVFEGPEGSGKGTQKKLFLEKLKKVGISCVGVREPGGTPLGEDIRKILKSYGKEDYSSEVELGLFNAARRNLFDKVIEPSLNQGNWVVSDRDSTSSLAYQCFAGGVDLDEAQVQIEFATRGIKPDITYLFLINPEKGLSREKEGGRFTDKGLDYHQEVFQAYHKIGKQGLGDREYYMVDISNLGIGDVEKHVAQDISSRFNISL
jgi:dTMP kinase